MLTFHGAKIQWSATLLLAMLLAMCVSGSVLVVRSGHQYRYADAQSRWNASGLTHYRLRVTVAQSCVIMTEVRTGQLTRVEQQDSCMHPARTVTDLFALIERGQLSERCFFAGCACRIDVITDARYDPTYGYPLMITMRYDRSANWWTRGFWGYILDHGHLPGCAKTSEASVIQSISVTPLQ